VWNDSRGGDGFGLGARVGVALWGHGVGAGGRAVAAGKPVFGTPAVEEAVLKVIEAHGVVFTYRRLAEESIKKKDGRTVVAVWIFARWVVSYPLIIWEGQRHDIETGTRLAYLVPSTTGWVLGHSSKHLGHSNRWS